MDVILDESEDGDAVRLSRALIRFPMELRPPPGFDPEDTRTWPPVDGRLEYVGGRLLYMPPCGDDQGDVAGDVVHVLKTWAEKHPQFKVSGNEIGMYFDGEARGADAAVWLRSTLPPNTGGLRRVPPILSVEVAGRDDSEASLRAKAQWCFGHGVQLVWVVLPASREVIVMSPTTARRLGWKDRLPEAGALPGLKPRVSELMAELGPLRRARGSEGRRH